MLVIKSRGGDGGMRRFNAVGSGIFDSITRKMFASGLKKAISTGAKTVVAQKVADAVVNGATSATKKAVESVVNEAINSVKPIIKQSLEKKIVAGQKRSSPSAAAVPVTISIPLEESVVKKKKKSGIDINSLIDGAGIVFD